MRQPNPFALFADDRRGFRVIDARQAQRRRRHRAARPPRRGERPADGVVERRDGALDAHRLNVGRPALAAPDNRPFVRSLGQERNRVRTAAVDPDDQVGVGRRASRIRVHTSLELAPGSYNCTAGSCSGGACSCSRRRSVVASSKYAFATGESG